MAVIRLSCACKRTECLRRPVFIGTGFLLQAQQLTPQTKPHSDAGCGQR